MEEPLGRQDVINKFKEICAVDDQIAREALESKNWNLETAVRVFLDGEDHNQPAALAREENNQQQTPGPSQNVPIPVNNQRNSFMDWLTGFALAPLRIAIWSLRFLFDFFYSMFGGPPLPVSDPRTEITQFVQDFRTKYDTEHAIPWLEVPYNSAVNEARRNISYLLVYVHNPTHQRTDEFARDYLLSPEFLSYIRNNNVSIWGASIRSSEGYKVCSALHDFNFPFIALLCMVEGRSTCIFRLSGDFTLPTLIDGLQNATQAGQHMLDRLHQERAQREMTNQLRREQENDYQRSLAADRAKVQERKRLESEKIESQKRDEELRRQQEEKLSNLEARRREIAQSLPPEPAVNGGEIVRVSVRFPSGQKFERRFNIEDNIELLFNAVFANENCPRDFVLLSSYPRKELKCAPAWYRDFCTSNVISDGTQTFRDAGLTGPVALLVKDNEA